MSVLVAAGAELLRLSWIFAPLVALELLFSRGRPSLWSRLRAVAFWVLATPFGAAAVLGFSTAWRALGVPPLVVLDMKGWPLAPILGFLVAASLRDLLFYGMHRAQHRFFWRFHAVHHSVEELSAVSSYHHVTETLFQIVFIFLPSALFVTRVDHAVWLAYATTVQGMYLHSNTRLNFGPLRYLFSDNRLHRIHHSREPQHFDKNFSAFTPLWDVVFGTAYWPTADEWPATGVPDFPEPKTVASYLTAPFRRSVGQPEAGALEAIERRAAEVGGRT